MSEAAFLAAIRAEPADDAVRLVYADWLQENGEDARAELIRVQIELSRPLPPQPSSMTYSLVSSEQHIQQVLAFRAATKHRRVLEVRERELLAAARVPLPAGWAVGTGLGLTVRAPRGDLFLRHGLGERAVCSWTVWATDGEAVLSSHPVERVRLTNRPPHDFILNAIKVLHIRFGSHITFEFA